MNWLMFRLGGLSWCRLRVFRVVSVVWVVCLCMMDCGGIEVMLFSVFLFLVWWYFVLNLLE